MKYNLKVTFTEEGEKPYEAFNLTWVGLANELEQLRERNRTSLTSFETPNIANVEITNA